MRKKWRLQYLQDAIIIIDDFGVKTADLKGYIQSYLKDKLEMSDNIIDLLWISLMHRKNIHADIR